MPPDPLRLTGPTGPRGPARCTSAQRHGRASSALPPAPRTARTLDEGHRCSTCKIDLSSLLLVFGGCCPWWFSCASLLHHPRPLVSPSCSVSRPHLVCWLLGMAVAMWGRLFGCRRFAFSSRNVGPCTPFERVVLLGGIAFSDAHRFIDMAHWCLMLLFRGVRHIEWHCLV